MRCLVRAVLEPETAESVDDVLVCDLYLQAAGGEVGCEQGGHVWEELTVKIRGG